MPEGFVKLVDYIRTLTKDERKDKFAEVKEISEEYEVSRSQVRRLLHQVPVKKEDQNG